MSIKNLLRIEAICIAALLTTAAVFGVFGAIDSLKFPEVGMKELVSAVFFSTLFIGIFPTVLVGAPLFWYLRFKDIWTIKSALLVGLILGIISALVLRDLGAYGFLASTLSAIFAWLYDRYL